MVAVVADFKDREFRWRYCDVERKYTNGGRASLIAHSESGKHRKIADGKRKGDWQGCRIVEGACQQKICAWQNA